VPQSRAWSSAVVPVNWCSKDAVLARVCFTLLPHLVELLRLALVRATASRLARDSHPRFAIVELSVMTDPEEKQYGAYPAAVA
jgi:hypothetical protein